MNAKFECLGFSVARKHVYFYSLLIVGSLFANTIKDQFAGQPGEENKIMAELSRATDQFTVAGAVNEP